MNSTCVPDVGYFDSPEFLSLILHINTIISTPIHLFGFYCIKWKSPIAMKSAKPYLLNLHLWMVLSGYSFSILTIPYLLIPQIAGYTLGVFSWFDVPPLFQLIVVLFFLSNFNASIVSLFESRFFVVCKFAWKPFWERWRIAATIFYHIFLSCNVPLLGVFAPVQETAKINMFTKLPCLPQYTFVNIFVLCEDCSYHLTYLVAVVMFCGCTIVSFAVLLMWNAVVQLRSRTMSEKTFQLQKSFLVALAIQILTPLSMFGLPVIYIWIAIILNHYNQTFTNFSVCSLSLHGLSSSLTMILVHRPYREILFSFFKKNVAVRSGEYSFKSFFRTKRDVSVVVV